MILNAPAWVPYAMEGHSIPVARLLVMRDLVADLWRNYWLTQRRRPPYVSRYDWWLAPWVTTAAWVVQRRNLCCGLKKPHHKMQCSRR